MSEIAMLTPGVVFLLVLLFLLLFSMYTAVRASTTAVLDTLPGAVDVVVFGALLAAALMYVQTDVTVDDLQRHEVLRPMLSALLTFLDTTDALMAFGYTLALLYVVDAVLTRVTPSGLSPLSFFLAKQVAWICVLVGLSNAAVRMAFGKSVMQSLKELLWRSTSAAATGPPPPPKHAPQYGEDGQEVFHIGNQLYTFAEAGEVCRMQGARLATVSQLYDAQQHGADWMGSYGWSAGQAAYTVSADKGLQGGPVPQADLLMGANCFGPKPVMTDQDRQLMNRLRMESMGLDEMSQAKLLFAQLKPELFMRIQPFSIDSWKAFSCEPRTDADAAPPTSAVSQDRIDSLSTDELLMPSSSS